MLPGGTRSRGGTSAYRLAAALTAVIVVAVAAVTVWNVELADRLMAENGLTEWLQVVLFAFSAVITARLTGLEWAAGRSGAPDLLLTAAFLFVVVTEMELPRHLLGKSIKIGRMVRDVEAGVPREVLFVLVVAVLAVGLAVYALRHRVELFAWGWAALGTPWGRLLFLSGAILVFTETFERWLNHVMGSHGLPRPLLEEGLELLASLYCFLAMWQRRAHG